MDLNVLEQTNDLSSRQKILLVARHLFRKKGLREVSVRDIAAKAHVNLSAVNYYFRSKERLVNEVLLQMRDDLCEQFERIYQEKKCSFTSLCKELFYFYLNAENEVIRLFMLSLHEKVIDFELLLGQGTIMGPPGVDTLLKALKQEVACDDISVADQEWAVKTMGLHVGSLANFHLLHRSTSKPHPQCKEETLIQSIELLADAVLLKIKSRL